METFETVLNAANDFFKQNNYDEALKEYAKALAMCEADGEKHSETAMVNRRIGDAYLEKGNYEEALKSYQKAAEILKNSLGEEHFRMATAYNDIGAVYYRAGGKYQEALQWRLKAAEICKKTASERKINTAIIYSNVAGIYVKLDQQTEAAAWYLKSLSVYSNVIEDYVKKGDYVKAGEYEKEISKLAENILPKSRREIVAVYSKLAETFKSKSKYYDALKWYNRIFEIESGEIESLENPDELFTNNWLEIRGKYLSFHDKYSAVQKMINTNTERKYENLLNRNSQSSEDKKEINSQKNKAVPGQISKTGFTASGMFLRKARGTNISRQAQRVFLCFDRAGSPGAEDIIDDLLSDDAGMDCAVSFVDADKPFNEDDLRAELKETQVLVVYVTLEMLESISTNAIPVELRIAKELNIPILPVAQDDGLLPVFTEKTGKLHGIAKNDAEYRTKLKAQLENFLASEELQKTIASQAFTAGIFLSYRKVDLEEARAFMKNLHHVKGLQGISVWYDHFLTAGREFDAEIHEAIENTNAFVLLVTPHITEKNALGEINYVAREEVPFAVKKEKTIIPVEVKPRDASTFAVLFPNIGEPVSLPVLNEVFRAKLGEKAYIKTLGSERSYLLGMAYLLGYRMERDTEHAIELLQESAKAQDKSALDAAEQLAKIYEQGLLGPLSVNYHEALSWRQRALVICKGIYGKKHPNTAKAYTNVGKNFYNLAKYKEALRYYNLSYQINKSVFGLNHISIAENYNHIGEVYIKLNKIFGVRVLDDALKIYQDAYGEDHLLVAGILVNSGRINIEHEFYKGLIQFVNSPTDTAGGETDEQTGSGLSEYVTPFKKALEIYNKTYGEEHYSVAATYTYLGRLYILFRKYTEALENLFKSLGILEKIYGQNHPFIVFPLINIALAYSHLNENDKTMDYLSKALSLKEKFSMENQPALKQLYRETGDLYLGLNNYDMALKYFIKDVEDLVTGYDADEENKKRERKNYIGSKPFSWVVKISAKISGKIKNKALSLIVIIFLMSILMLISLIGGLPGIVKLIASIIKLNKKLKKEPDENGQLGSAVYSNFNWLDNPTMFITTLLTIRDKYIRIGDIYCMANDYNAALDYYNKALDIFKRTNQEENRVSETVTLYYDMGKAYFHSGNMDKALYFCGKALEFRKYPFGKIKAAEDDEETAKLYNILGEIYAQSNQFEKALEQFLKAAAAYEKLENSELVDYHQETALAYGNLGKTYTALKESEKATEFYSKAAPEYKRLAVDCRNRRKYGEAIEWYLKALDVYALSLGGETEETGGICNQIGGLYYIQHDYGKPLEWYEKSLEICKQIFGDAHANTSRVLKNIAGVFFARGNTCRGRKDYDLAIADYTEAIRLDPGNTGAYHNRGVTYANKKDYDLAIADYTEAIRLDPKNAGAYHGRGNAYGNKKDYDLAIADYNEALRLGPNNAIFYNSRGWTYYLKGDYTRALEDANRSLRIRPNNANMLDTRANAYYGLNDFDSAIADWEAVLKLDPDNAGIRENLERARAAKVRQ